MKLKRYIDFINEELREDEFNRILDKINKKEELTPEEQKELDEFDGNFDTSPQDVVEFDSEGDLLINGKRANPYNIPDELYDVSNKPTSLDDNLKEFIIDYLNNNYELRQTAGAHMKQIFTKENDTMMRPRELVNRVKWDLNIPDEIAGVFNFVQSWARGEL